MFSGYRLKQLRKEHYLSQEELGQILGVSKVSVSGYEKGMRVPSMDVLITMIKLFDVSADYLLGREVNAVCEDEMNMVIKLSSVDIEIIEELHSKPDLYNKIAENPQRFFAPYTKKDI